MKVPSTGSIIKHKAFTWGNEPTKFSYIYLKSRKKFGSKRKFKFVFEVESLEYKRNLDKYELVDKNYFLPHNKVNVSKQNK